MRLWGLLAAVGLILILSGCPEPQRELVGEFALDSAAVAAVPYKDGDTVRLSATDGRTLIFAVERRRGWDEVSQFVCGMASPRTVPYVRYEYDSVIMRCAYPQLEVDMVLLPRGFRVDSFNVLYIRLNDQYEISFFCDSSGFVEKDGTYLLDSVLFNGRTFSRVIYGDFLSPYSQDSGVVYFKTIYYNSDCGIVNLKMSDDEDFVCDN